MAVNSTNRSDAEAIILRFQAISEKHIQYLSGCAQKFRVHEHGKKTSKHDI